VNEDELEGKIKPDVLEAIEYVEQVEEERTNMIDL
jgi:hypothetical protein